MKFKQSVILGKDKKGIEPFLKWAGGKRWLLYSHPELFQTEYKRYIEPFLGSGSVFFNMLPAKAILSDRNSQLIDTYLAMKSDCIAIFELLEEHHIKHCKEHYYTVRKTDYMSIYERAAQLIYLNRTCWNGLYRVNLNNKFNVPIGTKTNVLLQTREEFKQIAKALKTVKILASDFEKIIDKSKAGDLVFVDPPYTVKHDNNGFIKYNDKLFGWNDQVRLRDAVERARSRGARIIVTNADHYSIKELYKGFDQFEAQRASVLAGINKHRGKVKELIITG